MKKLSFFLSLLIITVVTSALFAFSSHSGKKESPKNKPLALVKYVFNPQYAQLPTRAELDDPNNWSPMATDDPCDHTSTGLCSIAFNTVNTTLAQATSLIPAVTYYSNNYTYWNGVHSVTVFTSSF